MKPCRCPFVRNAPARQRRWDSLDWIHTTPSQRESPFIKWVSGAGKRAIGETQIDVEVGVLRAMSRLSDGGSQSPSGAAPQTNQRLRLALDRKLDNAALTHPSAQKHARWG